MARIKGPRKINRYSDEFKVKAIELADQPGILAKGVAADLGVHEVLLYRWRKEYREGKFSVDMRRKKIALDKIKMSELIHIRELEREINKLRIENELLKKTIEFNSEKRKTYSNS